MGVLLNLIQNFIGFSWAFREMNQPAVEEIPYGNAPNVPRGTQSLPARNPTSEE